MMSRKMESYPARQNEYYSVIRDPPQCKPSVTSTNLERNAWLNQIISSS